VDFGAVEPLGFEFLLLPKLRADFSAIVSTPILGCEIAAKPRWLSRRYTGNSRIPCPRQMARENLKKIAGL
jgi:hypothetical protein